MVRGSCFRALALALALTQNLSLTCRARASSSHSSHRSKPTVPSSDPRSPTDENEGVRALCARTGNAFVNDPLLYAPHTLAALRRARWNAQHLGTDRSVVGMIVSV